MFGPGLIKTLAFGAGGRSTRALGGRLVFSWLLHLLMMICALHSEELGEADFWDYPEFRALAWYL